MQARFAACVETVCFPISRRARTARRAKDRDNVSQVLAALQAAARSLPSTSTTRWVRRLSQRREDLS